jgi:hypothetical protein
MRRGSSPGSASVIIGAGELGRIKPSPLNPEPESGFGIPPGGVVSSEVLKPG